MAPRSVFAGVEEVEPGTIRVYVDGRDGRSPPRAMTRRTRRAVRESSRARSTTPSSKFGRRSNTATSLRMLRADVPVGSYLSGGLDSSLVAAMGLRAKGSRFSTFSLRFADAEYDETSYQRVMSQHLGSDHHEVMVTRGDIARVFPEVVLHTERPVLRTARCAVATCSPDWCAIGNQSRPDG